LASRQSGLTGENLVQLLETRLDALVLRSGMARSIYQARQLVGHGHFRVNGKKVTVPSARLRAGDTVAIKQESRPLRVFNDRLSLGVPTYLEVRDSGYEASLLRIPQRQEVPILC